MPVQIIDVVTPVKGLWSNFVSLYYYTKKPVIVAYNAGNVPKGLYGKTDAQLVAEAMAQLHRIYKFPASVEPKEYYVTRYVQAPKLVSFDSSLGRAALDPSGCLLHVPDW